MADTWNMLLDARKLGMTRTRSRVTRGRSLGLSLGSTAKMARELQRGLSYSTFVHFCRACGIPVGTIADLVQIPQRTLMRRKAKGRLQPDESERLLRISGIFEKAVGLSEGDAAAARRWLTTPSKELDGQTPLDFSRTEIGAREVEDLIGRLEHGVFT